MGIAVRGSVPRLCDAAAVSPASRVRAVPRCARARRCTRRIVGQTVAAFLCKYGHRRRGTMSASAGARRRGSRAAARWSSISLSAATPAARLTGRAARWNVAEVRLADPPEPEAQRRDIGLVVVLLPEQPAQHVRLLEAVLGDERRAARRGTSRRRCSRAGNPSPTCSTGMRPLALTFGKELRRARLALHDVVFAPFAALAPTHARRSSRIL